MTEATKTVNRIGAYIEIRTKSRSRYNFQNHSPGVVRWNGKDWSYVPIDIIPPPRNLDLDNVTVKGTIVNIPEILEAVKENNGFRDAVVFLYCIYPESLNAAPFAEDILLVRGSKIVGAAIEIDMQSPFGAINALFPNVYYLTGRNPNGLRIVGYVPEVPIVSSVTLR